MAEQTKGLSFGNSAIFLKDPSLSVLFSRRVWLYRVNRISVLEIVVIDIRSIFFVNMQDEIVKSIFWVNRSDEMRGLDEVSNDERRCQIK